MPPTFSLIHPTCVSREPNKRRPRVRVVIDELGSRARAKPGCASRCAQTTPARAEPTRTAGCLRFSAHRTVTVSFVCAISSVLGAPRWVQPIFPTPRSSCSGITHWLCARFRGAMKMTLQSPCSHGRQPLTSTVPSTMHWWPCWTSCGRACA